MTSECVIIEDTDLSEDEPGPARKLHKPTACQFETKWFQHEYKAPSGQVHDSYILSKDVHSFQDLIWNHPHDRMVPGYGMTPRELASVPSDGRKGWLVSSHFFWLSQCLNKQDSHSRCFVFDPRIRKESVDKLLPSSQGFKITTVILVMSVGRGDDGGVFFGSDKMQGDHWAVSVIDMKEGTVNYCDTLGWAAPSNVLTSVLKYTRFAGLGHSHQLKLKLAHDPNEEQHICTKSCTNYPLQKCSDVCGVVAMVCIAVAALDKKLFKFLMQPLDLKVHLYLRDPTEYSYYLRYVLISWLARQHIDITKISLKSDYHPYTPLSKASTMCAGIKRKLSNDILGSPQSSKRWVKSSTKTLEEVSQCILQHSSNGASSSTILNEAVKTWTKIKKEKSYWKSVCKELTFNNSIEICRDQQLSISEYFQEFKKKRNNPIIFFNIFDRGKGRNDSSSHMNDIVLVVQTDYQKEMLKTYCKQCVCVEWIQKSGDSSIHFNLCTISVFVEGLYEVPVAWLISNKSDLNTVQRYLFDAVKNNVGDIQTDIFVGDLASVSYKHWVDIFSKPKKKMFCIWDIIHGLKNRLKTYITDEEVYEQLTAYICVFRYITDRDAFEIYKNAFLETVKTHSLEFHGYFITKYLDDSRDEMWASCYRVIPAASFVPFLKPFHETLNVIQFFQSGQMERIDVLFHKLMQFVIFLKRKLFITTSNVKSTSTLKEIQKIHQQPLGDLDFFQSVSGEEWYVRASNLTTSFSVLDTGWDSCKCTLRCSNCGICIHKYVCTCADYVLRPQGCIHIHLRQMVNKLNNTLNSVTPDTER